MAQVYFSPLLCLLLSLCLSMELIEATVAWPEGSYGLPKAETGCPLSPETRWTTGWRFEDTEDRNPNNYKSKSYHLDTAVGLDVNRTFCMKTHNDETTEWPKGKYCIFKKGDCPKGLDEGFVYWDDEDNKNQNTKGGTLPDGIYDRNTLIRYCCRTDGDKRTPVTLPVSSPFYLKAFNSSECQRVKGAIATKEFIRFDNEDYKNTDREGGSYPYGAGVANHKIYYCYYESCHFTLSLADDGEMKFTSPNYFEDGYPIAQTCTWRFVVPPTKTAHIQFLDVGLEGDDSIKFVLVNGLGNEEHEIVKKSDPSDYLKDYRGSPGLPLFVNFSSSFSSNFSRRKSKGFRAVFTLNPKSPSVPDWPSGTFGLPRAKLGCPQSDNNITWFTGWRYQDTEDQNAANQKSRSFHMDAVVEKSSVNRSFCIATKNSGTREWPKGQYCIYKKGECPAGLTHGYISFDDENHKNINKKGGTLPDGEYNKDTKIFFCCRTDGDKKKPMVLPLGTPFYLMAFKSSECQQVEGALATQEYIQFDDEDEFNKDSSNGTHAYEKGKVNLTISYCYYEACHYTFSEHSQEFTSPNYHSSGYPDSQYCSWRFLVRDNSTPKQQIVIKFPEFRLQKGKDGDVVRIYSGWDSNAPPLAKFDGEHPPPQEGVAAPSSVVFLVFISDKRGQSQGFRGLFLNQTYNASAVYKEPTTSPAETKERTTISPAVKTNQTTIRSASPPVQRNTTTETQTAVPSAAHGKQTSSESSSSASKVIIPVVIVAVILVAMIGVYCIRRKRMERRVTKRLSQSHGQLVPNGVYGLSQEYDSNEELQEIFPQG